MGKILSFFLFSIATLGAFAEGAKPWLYPDDFSFSHEMTRIRAKGLTLVNHHLHIRGGMTVEKAVERQEKSGILSSAIENQGREWPINSNEKLATFLDSCTKAAGGKHIPIGIQVNDRDWFKQLDPALVKRLDFVVADTMIFGVTPEGKPQRLWLPGLKIDDAEKWMDGYVKHNLQILGEPISILANVTYLPPCLADRYDELWTEQRMRAVIEKAIKNHIALEIQAEANFPKPRFLKLAKQMGATFSFGTNNFDDKVKSLARWFEAIEWLELTPEDLWRDRLSR